MYTLYDPTNSEFVLKGGETMSEVDIQRNRIKEVLNSSLLVRMVYDNLIKMYPDEEEDLRNDYKENENNIIKAREILRDLDELEEEKDGKQ